jgi:rSAM/selenodomain-associated transferase 2/rSAM/selenodomain-associated transferase 1
MLNQHTIKVIIPAYNEADSIAKVINAIPAWVKEIIVVNNNSTDQTAQIAAQNGATVIHEKRKGYGQACRTGIAAITNCDIVVFLDADFSDFPEQMNQLVKPIITNQADMVIGARSGKQGLTIPQRFGNALACFLMNLIWRSRFTDLGPFRAIRYCSLRKLKMDDRNYGWTIEMQIKALRAKLRIKQVPVSYRERIGQSKISGTLRGVIGAGSKILWTIFRQATNPTPISKAKPEKIILFTRFPLPGKAKTRLIPALGQLNAARLQRQLTEKTLQNISPLLNRPINIQIQYTDSTQQQIQRWLTPGGTGKLVCPWSLPHTKNVGRAMPANYTFVPQPKGNLGQKLKSAFNNAFYDGCEKVIIIGTDCPALNDQHIKQALNALNNHNLVLGPSTDGGYWLIGLNKPANIFNGIDWGSSTVLQTTLQQAQQKKLSIKLLDQLDDIDEPKDLQKLPHSYSTNPIYLTVIIPTLNEAKHIRAAIESVQANGVQIIVADGGSTDDTRERAKELGAYVVQEPPGRAKQMNKAAKIAKGEVLLFLHGDTFIQTTTPVVDQIFSTLSDPNIAAGAFTFATDHEAPAMRWIEKIVNGKNRLFHLPFGDQALFLRKEVFKKTNGFPLVDFGEDFYFVQKLNRLGQIKVLPSPAITSSQKWKKKGLILNTLINVYLMASLYLNEPRP